MGRVLALILDDGHGMETPGKRSPLTGMKENEFNREVVARLVKLCRRYGVPYLETAPTDRDTPLKERTRKANEWYQQLRATHGSALDCVYLSVHANAGGGTGVETWVSSKADAGIKALGAEIAARIARDTGLKNRGAKTGYIGNPSLDFAVNRDTLMDSVLIEHAFMDTPSDAALLLREDFREKCANADFMAVTEHYGYDCNCKEEDIMENIVKAGPFSSSMEAAAWQFVLARRGFTGELAPAAEKEKWEVRIQGVPEGKTFEEVKRGLGLLNCYSV